MSEGVPTLTFRPRYVNLSPVTETATTTEREARIERIVAAAIPVFAAKGFKGTSMADIAAAAGVSRPALYQYFENRADVFRAGFGRLLETGTDSALAELHDADDVAAALDGFVQRMLGDAYEQLFATPHGDELMEAKYEFAADVAAAATTRALDGLRAFLTEHSTGDPTAVMELLTMSPMGLKQDKPKPAAYRRRLSSLAQAATALLS